MTLPDDPEITIFENTREAWLNLRRHADPTFFDRIGYPLPPKIWISVGRPNKRQHAIGICHPMYQSDDGGTHIFIHPVMDDPIRVGGIVAHELCHAALDCEGGHGAAFQKLATAMGLVAGPGPKKGKRTWTATMEGPMFIAMMEGVVARIGPYPHAALRANDRRKPRLPQRLIKVICPECRFAFWSSAKWLKKVHHPVCLNPECERCAEEIEIQWPEVLEGMPHFERAEFEV
jgi:hypothetical protein